MFLFYYKQETSPIDRMLQTGENLKRVLMALRGDDARASSSALAEYGYPSALAPTLLAQLKKQFPSPEEGSPAKRAIDILQDPVFKQNIQGSVLSKKFGKRDFEEWLPDFNETSKASAKAALQGIKELMKALEEIKSPPKQEDVERPDEFTQKPAESKFSAPKDVKECLDYASKAKSLLDSKPGEASARLAAVRDFIAKMKPTDGSPLGKALVSLQGTDGNGGILANLANNKLVPARLKLDVVIKNLSEFSSGQVEEMAESRNQSQQDAKKDRAPYPKISWDSKVKLLPIDSMPQEFKDFTDWLATKFLDPDGGERFSRKQLNAILTGVLEYMQGKGWISEEEKKNLAFDAEKAALLKSIFAVWTGRTEKIAKATFDRMQDTDNKPFSVHEVLSHLRYVGDDNVATSQVVQDWQKASGPEKIKTAKAEKFWKDIVFRETTKGIELSAESDRRLAADTKINEEMASGNFSEATKFLSLPIVQDALKAAGVENVDANQLRFIDENAKSGEFYSVANLVARVQGDLQKKFAVVQPSEENYMANESYKNLSSVLDAIAGTNTLQTLKDLGYVKLDGNGDPVLVYSTTNALVGKGVLSSGIFGTKRKPKEDSEIAENEDVRRILLAALKDQFASLYPAGQEGRKAAIADLSKSVSGSFKINELVQDPSPLVSSKQAILDAAKSKVPGVVPATPTPVSLEELAFSNAGVRQALYYNADGSLKPKEEVESIKRFVQGSGFDEPQKVLNKIAQYNRSKQDAGGQTSETIQRPNEPQGVTPLGQMPQKMDEGTEYRSPALLVRALQDKIIEAESLTSAEGAQTNSKYAQLRQATMGAQLAVSRVEQQAEMPDVMKADELSTANQNLTRAIEEFKSLAQSNAPVNNISSGADLDLTSLGQQGRTKTAEITNIFTSEGNSELTATISTGIDWLDAAGTKPEVIAAYNSLPEKTRAGLLRDWANKISADPDSAPVSPDALPEIIRNLK
ncbi:MAG: hypothetical protein QW568_02240 [Candidatus Anstonellaceae archaeon]